MMHWMRLDWYEMEGWDLCEVALKWEDRNKTVGL